VETSVGLFVIVNGMHAGSGPLHPVRHRAPCSLLFIDLTRFPVKVKRFGDFFWVFFSRKTEENGVFGSQEKTATKCDNDKGIMVGVGPLPSPVYRLFGLVAVGP